MVTPLPGAIDPPAPYKTKSYANATKGNIEMTPILQDFIKIRDSANDNKNKIEITFKRIEEEDNRGFQYLTLKQ